MNIKKLIKKIIKTIYSTIVAIIKTIFVDLFVNIKMAYIYSFYPEKRHQLKRTLEAEKMVKLIEDRLKRVERLLYAIFEDPEYPKSSAGKSDLKELKKELK